jgi:hypothetical protein
MAVVDFDLLTKAPWPLSPGVKLAAVSPRLQPEAHTVTLETLQNYLLGFASANVATVLTPEYLTLALDKNLKNERRLVFGDGNATVDNGPNDDFDVEFDADTARMARIAGSTFSSVQQMQDTFHSTGWLSGGAMSDAGGADLDVADGTGLIRATDNRIAEILNMDWPQSLANAIPADTTRYVGIEYNAGSPQVVIKTTDVWNLNTEFPLGGVVNEGGTLHIFTRRHEVGDHANFMIQRMAETDRISRDDVTGGLILGETGTRNPTMTAGALWTKLNRNVIAAIDTSVADTFDRYYRDGGGGWTKEAAQTQWPNTQYDDGSGTLATLSGVRWSALYFYVELDGDLVMLYGQAQYTTAAGAELDSPPSTVPDRLVEHGTLIGRIIFQKNAATGTPESVFVTLFTASGAVAHSDLSESGMATGDDHTQYLHEDGRRPLTDHWAVGDFRIDVTGPTPGPLTTMAARFGDYTTPDYGMIQIGDFTLGRSNLKAGNVDIDGTVVFRNGTPAATGPISFCFANGSNAAQFAISEPAVGNASYNARSFLIAGPTELDSDIVTVGFWQAKGIFDNLLCDTDGFGADLGVQHDLEVENDIFTDSIKESTAAAGVTIQDVLIDDDTITVSPDADGTVDGSDTVGFDLILRANNTALASRLGDRIVADTLTVNDANVTWPTGDNPVYRALVHTPVVTGIDVAAPTIGAFDISPLYGFTVAQAWGIFAQRAGLAFTPTWRNDISSGGPFTFTGTLTAFWLNPKINMQARGDTWQQMTAILLQPQLQGSAGTLSALVGLSASMPTIQAGQTVTNMSVFAITAPIVNGTLTNFAGFKITDKTGPGTNIAFHHVGTNAHSRFQGKVMMGSNTAPATSAALELSSTTGALLLPRMTTTQQNALTAVNGMIIYNTTTGKIQGREGGAWVDI